MESDASGARMAATVRFHEVGGPDVLRIERTELPPPGAGEVLVEIEAFGLNRGEAAFRAGHYLVKPALPSMIGGEASGRILEIGADVTGFAVGDPVLTLPSFPIGSYGVWATRAILPASCLFKRPADLDPVVSAASWVAFFTAWGGLVDAGRIEAGQHVILPAASSAVGLAAIQIVRDLGAVPIATTRSSDKIAALEAAGAEHVLTTGTTDLPAEIRRITGGRGAALIFDPVAGPFMEVLMECLADGGSLIVYGGMSDQPGIFPRRPAIRRNLTMRGFNFAPVLIDPERRARAFAYILKRLRDGRFVMPIAHLFPLEAIVDANAALERNEHVGKIVVRTRDD